LRNCIVELYTDCRVTYNIAAGVSRTEVFQPKKEIANLSIIARCLVRLSKLAETNDQDAFIFEAELSSFVREVDCVPQHLLTYPVGETMMQASFADLKSKRPLLSHLGEALQNAIGYYFDRGLHEDWALLLATILPPCCSGDGAWLCLGGRFKHVWRQADGEWMQPDRPCDMLAAVMLWRTRNERCEKSWSCNTTLTTPQRLLTK